MVSLMEAATELLMEGEAAVSRHHGMTLHGTAVEAIAPPTAKTIGAAAEPQNQGGVLRWQRGAGSDILNAEY